jgi:hypothetical protein
LICCGAARLRTTAVVQYSQLLDVIRRRRAELNISFETLDALSGVCSGYSAKILGPTPSKCFGPVSLGCILGALGLKLVVSVDRIQTEQMERRWVPRQFSVPSSGPQAVADSISARPLILTTPAARPHGRAFPSHGAAGPHNVETYYGRRISSSVWRVRRQDARCRCAAA